MIAPLFASVALALAFPTAQQTMPAAINVRLALAGASNLSISWTTLGELNSGYAPECRATSSFSSKSSDVASNSTTVVVSTNPTSVAYMREISWHHHVLLPLTEIEPNGVDGGPSSPTWTYRCGDWAYQTLTNPIALEVPTPRTNGGSLSVIFGDMGNNNSATTINAVHSAVLVSKPDFVFHVGDISYADDLTQIGPNPRYEAAYDKFMSAIERTAAAVPYFVIPGNHDVSCHAVWTAGCDPRTDNFSAYRARWRMPWAESGATGSQGLWYSYNIGVTHFVAIDTESDYPHAPPAGLSGVPGPFGDQMGWLDRDLAAAAANPAVAWIVVFGHRPWLTCAPKPDWPPQQRKVINQTFGPLFEKFGVDLYVTGHIHAYERTDAVAGTVHIVNGAAGNIEGHQVLAKQDKWKPWTLAVNDEDYGFGQLEVVNSSMLTWTFHRATDGATVDSMTLTKGSVATDRSEALV